MYLLFLETVTTPDKEYIYQHPIQISEQSDENCKSYYVLRYYALNL